jgi:hypothetical protein
MVRYAPAFLILATLVAGCGSAFADPASPGSGEAGLRRLDAPAAASAAPAVAQPLAGSDPRPRLYSLHRDYGETPDRAVLPPEFFLTPNPAATDLAAPPPAPARDRQGRVAPADPDTPQT